MKFVCDRCLTKYSIADEKVRGRILKVRCKSCSNIITVKESAPVPLVADGESERTVITSGPHMAGGLASAVAAAVAAPARAAASPALAVRRETGRVMKPVPARPPGPPAVPIPPSAALPADGIQWFLAVEGVQEGPFTRKALVDRLVVLPRGFDVHVWNESLDGWKAPKDVPAIARDLQVRQRPVLLPPPPPKPRAVPPPPHHASAVSPRGLPGPSGTPLGLAALGEAAAGEAHPRVELSPSVPDLFGPAPGRNGVDAHASLAATSASAAAAPIAPLNNGESDALSALNLGGKWQQPSIAAAASASAEWQPSSAVGPGAPGRHRSLKLVVAFLLMVATCVVVLFYYSVYLKKSASSANRTKPVAAGPEDGFAGLNEKLAKEAKEAQDNPKLGAAPAGDEDKEAPVPSKPESIARVASSKKGGRGGAPHGAANHPGTNPPPITAASLTPEQQAAAARFGDTSGKTLQVRGGSSAPSRPAPAQGDITRVVNNNKAGIKICYQRALLRDSSLTHGKITVRVSIGTSGRVKNVGVDGPSSFVRAVEPCIKDVLSRWVFPPSGEEYGTEFSYLFQGNE
jgi:predicted Zn finger-like uncharacterized protein